MVYYINQNIVKNSASVKRFKKAFNSDYVTDFSYLKIIGNKITVLINGLYRVKRKKLNVKSVKSVLLKYDKTYNYVI